MRSFQRQNGGIYGNEIFLVKDKDYLCRQFNPPDIRNIRQNPKYQGSKAADARRLCASFEGLKIKKNCKKTVQL